MTQRKKLIELLNVDLSGCEGDPLEETADYLLANGVVVLPCKVGDTVYVAEGKKIYKATVTEVESNLFTEPHEWITCRYNARFFGLVEKKQELICSKKKMYFSPAKKPKPR